MLTLKKAFLFCAVLTLKIASLLCAVLTLKITCLHCADFEDNFSPLYYWLRCADFEDSLSSTSHWSLKIASLKNHTGLWSPLLDQIVIIWSWMNSTPSCPTVSLFQTDLVNPAIWSSSHLVENMEIILASPLRQIVKSTQISPQWSLMQLASSTFL